MSPILKKRGMSTYREANRGHGRTESRDVLDLYLQPRGCRPELVEPLVDDVRLGYFADLTNDCLGREGYSNMNEVTHEWTRYPRRAVRLVDLGSSGSRLSGASYTA